MPVRQLTEAIASYFNRRNKRSCYGIEVTDVSPDQKTLSVSITLTGGGRYCCGEPGCHIGLFYPEAYERFREHLKAAAFEIGRPMTLRVLWIVESGALLDTDQEVPHYGLIGDRISSGYTAEEEFREVDAQPPGCM